MQVELTPESTVEEPPPADSAISDDSPVEAHDRKWLRRLFDVLILVVLISIALPIRWNAARGDFWLDEADYALASVRGFEANRWDLPERTSADRLIRLRHYHPPLIAHVMGL